VANPTVVTALLHFTLLLEKYLTNIQIIYFDA